MVLLLQKTSPHVCACLFTEWAHLFYIALFHIGRTSVLLNPILFSLFENITTIMKVKLTCRATATYNPVLRCVCVWDISMAVSVHVKYLFIIIHTNYFLLKIISDACAVCHVRMCLYIFIYGKDMHKCKHVHTCVHARQSLRSTAIDIQWTSTTQTFNICAGKLWTSNLLKGNL